MAKEVETGMEKGEMKKLLMLARKGEINCALAQGADPKFALLVMDKVKQGRPLSQELVKDFKGEARNPRFGTVRVNPDVDPKLAIFQIDKPVTSMAKKLVKTLKGTGITKVELRLDDGTLVESDAEEDETETGTTETEETQQAQTPEGVPPPPPPPPPQAPQLNAADLVTALRQQVDRLRGLQGVAPATLAQLNKFATDAGTNIKTGNLQYARIAIDQLRTAIDALPAGTAGTTGQAPPRPEAPTAPRTEGAKVTYAKSRLAWLSARKKVEGEIDKLREGIVAAFKDDSEAPELEKLYRDRVAPVLTTLDESLADKLDEAMNAADPTQHQKLVDEAKTIIKTYSDYLASEPLIDDLDDNPFVPLSIKATMTATLAALSKAVV